MTFLVVPGTGSLCVIVADAVYHFMVWHGVIRQRSSSAFTVLIAIEKGYFLSGHGIITIVCGAKDAPVTMPLSTGWSLREDILGRRMAQP